MNGTQTVNGMTGDLTGAMRAGQAQMARFSHNYECFMKGIMDVGARQAEFMRGMIEGSIEDLALLADARTPDALAKAELEMFRRSSERLMVGATRIGEAMQRMCAETAQLTRPV